jgi:Pro-kumamolisin, activation domain/Bacterial Ig-like domain (group 3)
MRPADGRRGLMRRQPMTSCSHKENDVRNCNPPDFPISSWTLPCLLILLLSLLATGPAWAQDNQASVSSEGSVTLARHTPFLVQSGSALPVSHYNSDQKLRVVLAVRPPHLAAEEEFLKQLMTKGSPNFHKFLTPEQWNARFAPSEADEQKVVDWAKSQGLTVTNRYNHRLIVDVEAPVSVLEKAFGVTINNYQVGDEVDFSNDRDPILPASLSGIVYSVQGLNNIERDHGSRPGSESIQVPDYLPGPVAALGGGDHKDGDSTKLPARPKAQSTLHSNVTNSHLDPSDLYDSQIYDFNGLQALGHCCNPFHLATGSPNVSSIAIAGFGQFLGSDITGFQTANPYLAYHYYYYYIDGTPFCSGTCATGETTEDVEYAIATSNSFGSYLDTATVYVYLGGNFNNSTYTDIYSQMLSDNTARVMSTSWSCTEIYGCSTSTMDARHAIFDSMVGQGWTLIAASGDRGATDDCNTGHIAVAYPGSDWDVLAAGGTSLQVYYPPLLWDYENAWQGGQYSGACSGNNGGSGGGVSSYYGKPYWQSASYMGGSYRLTPDLSLNALGVAQNLYINGAYNGDANGTSVVAPELAGFSAQENAYLLAIGNACGSGTSACSPMGNMQPWIYEEGINHNAAHVPFYDITSGCNSNDITTAGDLGYYCAGAGWDQVTGWGSANMMQLAWAINWEITTANGIPYTTFSGPAKSTWFNSDQIISWNIVDYSGGGGAPGTGIAGFTQGWDSIPPDSTTEPHGGAGDSFYSGPQYVNTSTGCLSFNGAGGCAGGSGQGCHTAHVRGWNNQGWTTGDSTYGPVCYDSVAPTIAASTNPTTSSTIWVNKPVVVSLTATDPGGAAASGIQTTYYAVNSGTCYPGSVSTCSVYGSPFTISAQGQNYVYIFTADKAGNFSPEPYIWVSIDTTAPTTTAALSGTLTGGSTYSTPVTVTLNATDALSGIASTSYQVDGGATQTYSGAFAVSTTGAHTIKFHSVDKAGNTEATKSVSFTVKASTTTAVTSSLNPSVDGNNVTFTVVVSGTTSDLPTGSVTIKDGTTTLTTRSLAGGVVKYTTNALTPGTHGITASYAGATNFHPSSSGKLNQNVLQKSTTTLTASVNPSSYKQSVTFTAKVSPQVSGTPTGHITFTDGATTLSVKPLSGGVATLTISTLSVGGHSIKAAYNGSTTYVASTSPTLTFTVNKATTTVTLASSLNPSTSGKTVKFTATVVPQTSGTPTGSVTFKNGTTLLGTVTLSGGRASFSTSTLAVGKHSITAHYGGDTNYKLSTSAVLTQTVNP